MGGELPHSGVRMDRQDDTDSRFWNFSKAPKKWGFTDCAIMDQHAATRCQLYVMSSGLADSSRSLEARAVHERCGHRVSVDGIRSRAGYKIQYRHFEFGTAYISFSTETRLRAGILNTQSSIPPPTPPRTWLWDLRFLTLLLRMLIFRHVVLCRWIIPEVSKNHSAFKCNSQAVTEE